MLKKGSSPIQIFFMLTIAVLKQKRLRNLICVLCLREMIFKLSEELLESKPFLEKTDLLDFPGARERWKQYEDDLSLPIIPKLLLRGKVAFLFNKYSTNYLINTLLFCHHHKISDVKDLPELLNRWIENFVGDSAQARQTFIDSSKIPPLFIISTMFNLEFKI